MKEIANLARIVTSRGPSHFPIIDMERDKGSKEVGLIKILLHGQDVTQSQAVKSLYGTVTENNVRALQRLKSRVRGKLLNHLYFLDHSDERFLVSRRYQLECLDQLHKVAILFAEGEYLLTEQLLTKCLRLAEQGEFTQYAVQCAQMLCKLYAELRNGNQFEKMDVVLTKLQRRLTIESEAERLHSVTQLALAGTVKSRREVLVVLPDRLKKLESLHRQANSYATFDFLYRLRLASHELHGDYNEIIQLTTQADKQLRDGSLNERRFDKRYNSFMQAFAYLRSRRPVQGLKLARVAINDFHPSSNNWFYFQENHVLLALHAQDYEYAQALLKTIIDTPDFSKQRPAAIERWDLYRAYADFVSPPARMGSARRVQIAQWAHMLPEFSQDKAGQNIAILILQTLHYMRASKDEEVMIRLERLRKYQQRHMAGTGMVRSRLFLRLLRVMVDSGFNAKAAAAGAKTLLNSLHNTTPPGEAQAEIEIIPYEHLWEIILGILRAKSPTAGAARSAASATV